jgi:phage FluMu protein Com
VTEIRCGACKRKLGEGVFSALSIKCPRCNTMNYLRTESAQSERLERLFGDTREQYQNRAEEG